MQTDLTAVLANLLYRRWPQRNPTKYVRFLGTLFTMRAEITFPLKPNMVLNTTV